MTAPNKQFPVRICCWEDVSLTCAEQLLKACGDTERLQGELVALLGTGDVFSEDKRSLIELDLFTYAIIFCAKKSFSPKQLSAFFTIVKSVHAMCVSTPFDNLQETFAYFRELLLRHSVVRPPFSMCLYSMNEVKEITDYVLSTYFKHFKLYKHAFTARVSLNLRLSYSGEKEEEEEKERVSSKSDLPAGEEKKNGQDVDEEGVRVKEEEEEGKGEGGEGGEGEVAEELELTPEQERLKKMISTTLTGHLKQLKVTVEEQLEAHERRLADRISALEASSSTSGKAKAKKK